MGLNKVQSRLLKYEKFWKKIDNQLDQKYDNKYDIKNAKKKKMMIRSKQRIQKKKIMKMKSNMIRKKSELNTSYDRGKMPGGNPIYKGKVTQSLQSRPRSSQIR